LEDASSGISADILDGSDLQTRAN